MWNKLRIFKGLSGIFILLLVGLGLSIYLGHAEAENRFDLSFNFKTQRKLEFQSQLNGPEYLDSDEVTAKLNYGNKSVGILLKALPKEHSEGERMAYKIQAADVNLQGFLLPESEKTKSRKGRSFMLSINGKEVGPYLYVEEDKELSALYE